MPAGWFQVPSFKTCETWPARKHQILTNSLGIPTSFQLDLADFCDQNNQIRHRYTRSDDSRHDLREKSLDLTKFSPNLGQIGRDLANFGHFSMFSIGFWPHSKPMPPTGKPTLLTVRLQVENLPTRSLMGRLQVGHKPNPSDPWTPLVKSSYFLGINSKIYWFLLVLYVYDRIVPKCQDNDAYGHKKLF